VKNNDQENTGSLKARALSLIRDNRLEEAKALFAHICETTPEDAESWYILSGINGMLGYIDEAGDCCRRVLALQPDNDEAHRNLGNVLLARGEHNQAIKHYETALQINPGSVATLVCMGKISSSLGLQDKAEAYYKEAVRLNPDIPGVYYNLGCAQSDQKKYDAALESYRRAIQLNPDYAEAYNKAGNALKELGSIELAMENYRHAIRLKPDFAAVYHNLAILLKEQGKLTTAEKTARQAIQIQPDIVEALVNLGNIHLEQGRVKAAIDDFGEALKISPHRVGVHSSLVSIMRYLPEYAPQQLFDEAQNWALCHAPHEHQFTSSVNHPDPRRRLRVGYVSGDLYRHPVGYFIAPALALHDKSRYEVFCYYNNIRRDDLTERLQQSVDCWRDVVDMSDQELARQIRRDGIDLLIDLAGHTKKNRLLTFALKPAPVQATWLGYYDTTGLGAMDYIIADRFLIPAGEERYYTERVVRLPRGYLCFTAPDPEIDYGPLPVYASGKLTFGCFNNPAKITEEVIACWSSLLRALPGSQLYLKYKSYADAGVRQRYQDSFARLGIAPERIRFAGQSSRGHYLLAYKEVDIGLDPFPFNGCATTVNALWMGVPVITLRGNRYAGRMGETLLTNAGLGECVADNEDEYIAKALALATDLPRLSRLRNGLRNQLLNSSLGDGISFTHELEDAYRNMWSSWCSGKTHKSG
jgi:protein O-GlcNAc transferase